MGFCRGELNTLAGGGGTIGLAFGLVLGRSGFRLENDLTDLLESESRDLILLATFEYDLVIGLGSLTVLGLGSLMMADRRMDQGWMDGWRQEGLQRQNNAKKHSNNEANCSVSKEPPQTSDSTQTRLSPISFSGL